MKSMNPTNVPNNINNPEWWNTNTVSSSNSIQSRLIDIFSQNIESQNTNETSWESLEQLYAKALNTIISYWKWDIVTPLKKSLWMKNDRGIWYKNLQDIKVSLSDIIDTFKHISIKAKFSPEHDAAFAKAFVKKIETTLKWLSQPIQDTYKDAIIVHKDYISSLDVLWQWLHFFFDECTKKWHTLTDADKKSILDTTVSFADIENESIGTEGITKENITESRKKGFIPAASAQEKLLNSHMTLYGVSKINTVLKNQKEADQRLTDSYSFWWIEQLWSNHIISDEKLSQLYPELKTVLESSKATDTDKYIARIKAMWAYLTSQNDELWTVLTSLVANDMQFSKLSAKEQEIYLNTYKKNWLASSKWSDLIDYFNSFGITKDECAHLVDAFFSLHSEEITLKNKAWEDMKFILDKSLLTWKTLEENVHLLQTQWLPFSFALSGDALDNKDLKKIHTRNNWFYGENIPYALTLLIWAKAIAGMNADEVKNQTDELQKQVNQETFKPENVWLREEASLNDIESLDWEDAESINNLSLDELHNAKQLYTRQMELIRADIKKLQGQEKIWIKELDWINKKLLDWKNVGQAQKDAWLKDKKDLEEKILDLQPQIWLLQEKHEDANEKRKHIVDLMTAKKKQVTVNEDWTEVKDDLLIPKKNIEKPVDYLKEATDKWNWLQWDKNAPFAVWSSICVDIPDVKWPLMWWKNPWARGEIISIDSEWNFEIKRHGIDEPLTGVNKDGKAIEWSVVKFYGASGIDEFQWKVWKMWKFWKKSSWKDFGMYLKETWLEVDKEYKDYLANFLSKVDFSSMYRKDTDWKILTEDKNRIKYLGWNIDDLAKDEKNNDTVKTQKVWYEIEQHEDGVTVSWKDREGYPYSKRMTPQEFMVFIMDKWLQTYTQNEVDVINTDRAGKWLNTLQSEIDKSYDIPARKKMHWTNLKSIWHAFKFWVDGVKKRLKDKQWKDDKKLEKAMLWSKRFQSLSKLPMIWDAFTEMYAGLEKELEQEKTKEIKDAMEEPEKYGADTPSGPYDYILNVGKFKDIASWGILTDEKKIRKFAWYYAYVLSKKYQYPRSLAEFDWQAVWVRWILGPDYQSQYFQYMNQLKDNVEKNPNDAESRKLESLWELWFMKKVFIDGSPELKNRLMGVFGKSFFTKMLWWFEKELFDLGAVDTVAKDAKAKLFNEAKKDYSDTLEQRRFVDMYGTLKWMGENIKWDPSNYLQWMMRLAYPILTWITMKNMDQWMREDYALLARQQTTPFGLYAKDSDGQKKLWELFGIISQHPSVWSDFLKVFAEYMPTATEDRPTEKQYPEFLRKLDTRWFNYGNAMLNLLTQSPWKLIEIQSKLEDEYNKTPDSSLKKQELLNKIVAIKHYYEKKVLDEEKKEVEIKLGGIVAEKHIMNLSPGAINRLLNYRNGTFQKDLVEDWPKAWKALTKQVRSYTPQDWEKSSKELYQFVLKKFITFFEDKAHFWSQKLKQLLVALKYSNRPNVMNVYLMNEIDPNEQAPKDVRDAIEAFQDFLKYNKPTDDADLKSILDTVIGKWTWDIYDKILPTWVKAQWKKANDKLKIQVEQDIMKEEWINILIDWSRKISIYRDNRNRFRDEDWNVLQKKEWWNKKWQPSKVVKFNVLNDKWESVKELECHNFDDTSIPSYESLLSNWDGGFYNNPFDWLWLDWF